MLSQLVPVQSTTNADTMPMVFLSSKMAMLKEEIKNQALILSFCTATLYVYGITFYQQYLNFWGLDPDMFPLPFERVLFQGFTGFTWLGAETLFPLTMMAFIWLMLSMGWYLVSDKADIWLSRKCKRWTQVKAIFAKTPIEPVPPKWLVAAGLFTLASAIALSALVLTLLFLKLADHYGSRAAESQQAKLMKAPETHVVAFKDQTSLKARLITCSSTHCALLVEGKAHVYRMDDIQSITQR